MFRKKGAVAAALISAITVRMAYPSIVQAVNVLSNDRLVRRIIREKAEAGANVF